MASACPAKGQKGEIEKWRELGVGVGGFGEECENFPECDPEVEEAVFSDFVGQCVAHVEEWLKLFLRSVFGKTCNVLPELLETELSAMLMQPL